MMYFLIKITSFIYKAFSYLGNLINYSINKYLNKPLREKISNLLVIDTKDKTVTL